MIEVIWRSDPILNPVGVEARIVEIDGEKTLEARFVPKLGICQKLKAIWAILTGHEYVISTIYGGMPNE